MRTGVPAWLFIVILASCSPESPADCVADVRGTSGDAGSIDVPGNWWVDISGDAPTDVEVGGDPADSERPPTREACAGFFALRSPAEVRALAALDCRVLGDGLFIGRGLSSLGGLEELSSVEVIQGELAIVSTDIGSLRGLENLKAVGALTIELSSIGPDLVVAPAEIAGHIHIDGGSIANLERFVTRLERVGGPIRINTPGVPQCQFDLLEERLRSLGYANLLLANGCAPCAHGCGGIDTDCDARTPPTPTTCPVGTQCSQNSATYAYECAPLD